MTDDDFFPVMSDLSKLNKTTKSAAISILMAKISPKITNTSFTKKRKIRLITNKSFKPVVEKEQIIYP